VISPGKSSKSAESRTIQRVCAWCGRIESPIVEATGNKVVPTPALPVSHTICGSCFVREYAEVERVIKARRRKTGA